MSYGAPQDFFQPTKAPNNIKRSGYWTISSRNQAENVDVFDICGIVFSTFIWSIVECFSLCVSFVPGNDAKTGGNLKNVLKKTKAKPQKINNIAKKKRLQEIPRPLV